MPKIGKIHIDNDLILAPMAGVCDIAYRVLCRRYGAGLVCTEMINITAVERKNKASMVLAKTCTEEKPVSLQLFGSRVEAIKKSMKIIEEDDSVNPDIIDFNFGCPVNRILDQGAGAALLKRPAKIKEILETLTACTDRPITAKIRIAKDIEDTIKTARLIESSGAAAIAVHGRTVSQMYSGKADWSAIKVIKESVNIPVIGNGDVWGRTDYDAIKEKTGCDFVMIGRAAIGDPFVFRDIRTGKKPTAEDKMNAFKEYIELSEKYQIRNFARIKTQAMSFTKGLHRSTEIRNMITRSDSVKEIYAILFNYSENMG